MKWVFKHHILQMFVIKLNTWVIFTHLKLWVAAARHNFKWAKIHQNTLCVKGWKYSAILIKKHMHR